MALKIMHDNFTAGGIVERGGAFFVPFFDEDTRTEDVFMFGKDSFNQWVDNLNQARSGLVVGSTQDLADLKKQGEPGG